MLGTVKAGRTAFIPLPPLREQRLIVVKATKLLEMLDTIEYNLASISQAHSTMRGHFELKNWQS